MTYYFELVQDLTEFLEKNRHRLTGEDIVLLNRVIDELKRAGESPLSLDQYFTYAVRFSEMILKLFDMN